MKKDVFIVQGQKSLYESLLLTFAVLALAGCSITSSSSPLAPRPPSFDTASMPREPITTVQINSTLRDVGITEEGIKTFDEVAAAYKAETASAGCSIRSRFDREAVLAYEWGEGGRSRLALDVDGIGFDQFDVEQVKLEYKIRFSAEPTRKQRCRYASGWQGMLGSGYNEMFLRQNDTVWHELGDLEEDLDENLSDLF